MLCIFLKIDGNRVYVDFTCMFTAIHPLFGKDIQMSLHEVERLTVIEHDGEEDRKQCRCK